MYKLFAILLLIAASCNSNNDSNSSKETDTESTVGIHPSGFTCDDFKQNADLSWSPNKTITIEGKQINPDESINKGTQFGGVDVAQWLENNCN